MHLSLVVLYLFCWTGRVSLSPRTQIGLVRCLINGLFLVFCFCLQSVNQTAARSTMDLDEELKRTCQNISTGYYPRVYTLFSPLQWQRITCTQCYLCLDGVFCFTDLMLCWQCGIGKKHLRIVEPAASIFSSRLPIVCTHRPTLPMPYPLSIILILFFRSSQFSCKILVIYWRLIVLFCFDFQSCFRNISRSGLFP